jgi:hypothetical protein
MAICILHTLIATFAILQIVHAEPTILSYIVEHEIDDVENYVEITLTVQA